MARGGIAKSKLLLMRSNYREANRATSTGLSKFSGTAQGAAERCGSISKNSSSSSNGKIEDATCWVPHPRTGIYFPKGHEWVMEDIPKSAACFSQTCWFRNVDGVEYNPNIDKDV